MARLKVVKKKERQVREVPKYLSVVLVKEKNQNQVALPVKSFDAEITSDGTGVIAIEHDLKTHSTYYYYRAGQDDWGKRVIVRVVEPDEKNEVGIVRQIVYITIELYFKDLPISLSAKDNLVTIKNIGREKVKISVRVEKLLMGEDVDGNTIGEWMPMKNIGEIELQKNQEVTKKVYPKNEKIGYFRVAVDIGVDKQCPSKYIFFKVEPKTIK